MQLPFEYSSPLVLETFDALEVMGPADGAEVIVGNGSQLPPISIAG